MKGGEITNLKVGDPANTEKPMEIDFDVAVSNYFDWSASDPKLPLPILDVRSPSRYGRRQQESQADQVGCDYRSLDRREDRYSAEVRRAPAHRHRRQARLCGVSLQLQVREWPTDRRSQAADAAYRNSLRAARGVCRISPYRRSRPGAEHHARKQVSGNRGPRRRAVA